MGYHSADYRHSVPQAVSALLKAADEAQERQRIDDAESLVDWIYVLLEEEARVQSWRRTQARVA